MKEKLLNGFEKACPECANCLVNSMCLKISFDHPTEYGSVIVRDDILRLTVTRTNPCEKYKTASIYIHIGWSK